MGRASNCRGMVLCHDKPVQRLPDRLHAEAKIGAIEAPHRVAIAVYHVSGAD